MNCIGALDKFPLVARDIYILKQTGQLCHVLSISWHGFGCSLPNVSAFSRRVGEDYGERARARGLAGIRTWLYRANDEGIYVLICSCGIILRLRISFRSQETGEDEWRCQRCDYSYDSKEKAVEHIRNSVNHILCLQCPHLPEFSTMRNLYMHMHRRHSLCLICGVFFPSVKLFHQHMASHPRCKRCQKYFFDIDEFSQVSTDHDYGECKFCWYFLLALFQPLEV